MECDVNGISSSYNHSSSSSPEGEEIDNDLGHEYDNIGGVEGNNNNNDDYTSNTIWYAYYSPKENREYYYEPTSRRVTWVVPDHLSLPFISPSPGASSIDYYCCRKYISAPQQHPPLEQQQQQDDGVPFTANNNLVDATAAKGNTAKDGMQIAFAELISIKKKEEEEMGQFHTASATTCTNNVHSTFPQQQEQPHCQHHNDTTVTCSTNRAVWKRILLRMIIILLAIIVIVVSTACTATTVATAFVTGKITMHSLAMTIFFQPNEMETNNNKNNKNNNNNINGSNRDDGRMNSNFTNNGERLSLYQFLVVDNIISNDMCHTREKTMMEKNFNSTTSYYKNAQSVLINNKLDINHINHHSNKQKMFVYDEWKNHYPRVLQLTNTSSTTIATHSNMQLSRHVESPCLRRQIPKRCFIPFAIYMLRKCYCCHCKRKQNDTSYLPFSCNNKPLFDTLVIVNNMME